MATKQVVIEKEDILLVQALAGEFDYAKGTKMEGQKYRRFNYGGKVFISNDETFHTELEKGGVSKVTLDSDAEGQLSLTGYITFKKLQGLRKNQVMLDLITPETFMKVSANVKELEELAAE